MPRQLSPFLTDFFASRAAENRLAYNTHFAVSIKLSNDAYLHLATGGFVMSTVSKKGASIDLTPFITFTGRLNNSPEIRLSQTGALDGGQIEVINLDYLISSVIPDDTRLFDNAECTAYVCFPKPDGTFEGLIVLVGRLREISGDDESAKVSLISDMSDKNSTVTKEITQRCINELGDSWCGVGLDTLPMGAICSKVFGDKEAGCVYWGGVFNGIAFINPSNLIPQGGGIGGWDGEPPIGVGGSCPAIDSFLLTRGGVWKPCRDLDIGDYALDHRGRLSKIINLKISHCDYRYLIRGAFGCELVCSAGHPVLVSSHDETGTPVHKFNFDLDLEFRPEYNLIGVLGTKSMIMPFVERKLALPGDVIEISLAEPNHIIVNGQTPGKGIAGHNIKPYYNYNS